jgi:hypothetical protein
MSLVSHHDYYYSKMMIFLVYKSIFTAELIIVAVQSKLHKAFYYSEQWDHESWHGCMSICLPFVGRGEQRADSLIHKSYDCLKESVSEVNSEFKHARGPNV